MTITIPLYVILFIYLAFLAVFLIFSLLNFYHIVVTGSFAMASFIMSFFIFSLTILTLYFTYQLLIDVNWQQTLLEFNTNFFQASPQF
ncbi:MAG: hypothetical protein US42_C0018G0004 [Candidatus Magasanikbacteria bacterium GW2011_GWC2_37_14]|uniref:Uncharacterized protein n=1 Tax=Candidatus Magasanikbacteria bacterium GW2011_GWC2_37_14 TaxID=1619046 RepID=A0A0G0GL99_9BACT|nr:MAG: hypothetical protein US42_C0018G0004 [Candidatus Magasanikbacteria bacterium GW2011_GWC2_37_14]